MRRTAAPTALLTAGLDGVQRALDAGDPNAANLYTMDAATREAAGIELLPGKLVVEIKQTGFTKATAVRELMTYAPFADRRPIFLGDDETDLGVFEIMPAFDGIGISVGRNVPGVKSCFERPTDVRHWLEQISRTEALAAS